MAKRTHTGHQYSRTEELDIAECLAGFASRLNLAGLADALRLLQVHLHAQLPPRAFAARVEAELIRLGMTAEAAPPPA